MISLEPDLCIIIATKDRPEKLNLLLNSISESTLLPKKIIIVYSGSEISNLINIYTNILNIEAIYSEVASQLIQKRIGINALTEHDKWVLFLDDDVVVDANTLETLVIKYIKNPKFKEFAGFGLSITNVEHRQINPLVKIVLFFFRLYSYKPGSITKSGHPQSYLEQKFELEVDWLNGISVWKNSVLSEYSQDDLNLDYSAYEDVIFSYKVSKKHRLQFAANVNVVNQSREGSKPLTSKQFMYGSYMRYYFVTSNKEFSKISLLVSQLLRSYDYIARNKESDGFFHRLNFVYDIWLSLFLAVFKNTDGKSLIKLKC
jgi:GT2 family glycosyltransferase